MPTLIRIIETIGMPLAIGIVLLIFEEDLVRGLTIFAAAVVAYCMLLLYVGERRRREQAERETPQVTIGETVDNYIERIMLNPHEGVADSIHRYQRLEFEGDVDAERNYHASYKRYGTNIGKKPSHSLILQTATDCNCALSEMNMSVKDLGTGRELQLEPIKDERFLKVCRVHFERPVAAGEEFAIEWQFTWPHAMRPSGDFDAFDLTRFGGGVESIDVRWVFAWELRSYVLWEESEGRRTEAQPQPEHCINDQGRHVYTWGEAHPRGDRYIFAYL